MTTSGRPGGMTAFTIIWSGQMVSHLGTRMVNFALGIWIWQETNRAVDLSLMTVLAFGATVAVSPVAGTLVDRWSRRASIVVSDVGLSLVAMAALTLFLTGTASLWPLLLVNAVTGGFLAFQFPAYTRVITALLAKEQYPRANGMISMVRSVPAVIAPGIAAALLVTTGIEVVLMIAAATYLAGITTVLLVALPASAAEQPPARSRFWQDSVFGFRYLGQRSGLIGLQAVLFVVGLVSAMGFVLLTPLILVGSGDSEAQLGAINSIGAVGGVLGAIVLGVLKPPTRRMPRVLLGILVFSIAGRLPMVGDIFLAWAIGWFISWMCVPFIEGYTQTILQVKIPPAVQGRVFAAIQSINQTALLVGFASAGPLVDYVFGPQMASGGGLAEVLGPWLGTGPAAGIKVVFLLSAGAGALAVLFGFAARRVRELEDQIPDHDHQAPPETGPEAAREEERV